MSRIDAPSFFDCCRAAIAELLDADAGMDVIQRAIDAYALDREQQDALWLWAIGRPTGASTFAPDRPFVARTQPAGFDEDRRDRHAQRRD